MSYLYFIISYYEEAEMASDYELPILNMKSFKWLNKWMDYIKQRTVIKHCTTKQVYAMLGYNFFCSKTVHTVK